MSLAPLTIAAMSPILYHAATLAAVAVLIVLILGLLTMLRGTRANLSQTLMRWRVGLQFVAIVVIMAALYMSKA